MNSGRPLGRGRDRTGDQHGSLTVLGRDEENPHRWRVRWGCCGREMVVDTDYIRNRVRTLPTRCRACVDDGKDISARAVRDRERKQRLRDSEQTPEKPQETTYALRLTDKQRRMISELRELGMSYRDIANRVGKNYETVRTFCNRRAEAIQTVVEKAIDPGDISGLWERAMRTVRERAQ